MYHCKDLKPSDPNGLIEAHFVEDWHNDLIINCTGYAPLRAYSERGVGAHFWTFQYGDKDERIVEPDGRTTWLQSQPSYRRVQPEKVFQIRLYPAGNLVHGVNDEPELKREWGSGN